MLIDGHIAVNSLDLQLYVNKTFAQNLSVKAVASMLSAIGARSIRVRGPKIREQAGGSCRSTNLTHRVHPSDAAARPAGAAPCRVNAPPGPSTASASRTTPSLPNTGSSARRALARPPTSRAKSGAPLSASGRIRF
jgi:hypothetical protein